jgi:hypothetical protein
MIPGRYLEFHNIFTVLDASQNRYMVVHRIGLRLRNFLSVGFSEALLFGGTLEPVYMNPFLPYYLSQWGIDRDDNIMWCFDLSIRAYNSRLYGELLIDDYMYEDDPYPDKLAYRIGIKSVLFNHFFMRAEYTFVDKWVYTHHHEENVYARDGYPLGFPSGNDVDKVTLAIKYMTVFGLYPDIRISYTRKGEGSIFLPYEEEGGDWTPPFPSGIVEKNFEVTVGLQYVFRYNFYIQCEAGKRYYTNRNHISGNDDNETILNVGLSAIF